MNFIKHTLQITLRRHFYAPSSVMKRGNGAYDAPGKTTTEIINHNNVSVNMIDAYSQTGFRLTNNSFLYGPSIILRDKTFYWNISGDFEINVDSLQLFFHLYPPVDLLIIGMNDFNLRRKLPQNIYTECRKHNFQVEILPTEKAVTTFNFLVEIRNVAGAFVPPKKYIFTENDIFEHKKRLGILNDGLPVDTPEYIPISYPKEPKK